MVYSSLCEVCGMCRPSSRCRGVWSRKVSGCCRRRRRRNRRRLPCGQQGGSGPQGKALNFCQAQITTPFFTSRLLTAKIIPVPSHMNFTHMPWVTSCSDGEEFTLTCQSVFLHCCRTFFFTVFLDYVFGVMCPLWTVWRNNSQTILSLNMDECSVTTEVVFISCFCSQDTTAGRNSSSSYQLSVALAMSLFGLSLANSTEITQLP